MLTSQMGTTNLVLPDLALITVEPIRDAVIHFLAVREAYVEAVAAMQAADEVERLARETVAIRHGEILELDPTAVLDDPAGEIDAAEKDARNARARVNALANAGDRAARRLRETIAAKSGSWGKKSASAATKALADLTSAIRVADEAREKLYASVGVLGLLRAFSESPTGAPIAIQHKPHGYTFAIEAGMESLRDALSLASDELAAHKAALRPEKGAEDFEPAPAPAAPPTPSPAPAPTASDAPTFSIGADEDGDDDE